MEQFPTAIAIESLFRDAYNILEEAHGAAEHLDAISGALTNCHRSIQMLERIHREQIRSQNPDISQDIFGLRKKLDRFIASCNALNYLVKLSPPPMQVGCLGTSTKPTRKKKQERELQEEFWDHQRLLSLALANAIFMTTLDLQRQNSTPDPTLATILRQAEKRHAVHERVDQSSTGQNGKPTESGAEELEWEFCLRRYFDYLDSHGINNSNTSHSSRSQRSDPGISRYPSHLSKAVCAPVRQHPPPPARSNFSYRSYRQGNDSESHNSSRQTRLLEYSGSNEGQSYNEIYTRPRRNSTASTVSNLSAASRTNSWTGQYDSQSSPVTDIPRRRSQSFGTGVQWEQLPFGPEIAPNDGQHNSMGKAWNDIVAATRSMSSIEARAYIQGRLAGLDPNATAQIRHSLNIDIMPPTRSPPMPPQAVAEPPSMKQQLLPSPDVDTSRRAFAEPKSLTRAASAPVAIPKLQDPKAQRHRTLRETSGNARPKPSRRSSKKRLSKLRTEHTRALSTIVERPSTAKSKASSTKSRKSIFSLKKEKPPPLPDFPANPEALRPSYADSVKSTSSSKMRSSINVPQESRIIELDESSDEEISPNNSDQGNAKSSLAKQLPMTPDDLTTSPVKRMTRLFAFKRGRKTKTVPTPSIIIPPPAPMRSSASVETLHKASLDLRKNGSKSTICLVAIQEGPEQPFQVWLSALPYIEGESASPKV